MQFKRTSETRIIDPFISKIEDIPGGASIAVTDLAANLTEVKAGTPVGIDTNGLGHVVKQAVMQDVATDSATDYKVLKGHAFKVGDKLFKTVGSKSYAITAITTTETAYDTLTVGTTLAVALVAGDVLFEGSTAGASAGAFRYTPTGLVGNGFDIVSGDNPSSQVVVRGSVNSANLPNGAGAALIAALPLIRFN